MSSLPFPRAAVSCILRRKHTPDYLLIKRGNPPSKGLWAFCGGKTELGETTIDCALREVLEETAIPTVALQVHPAPITSTDAIYHDPEGALLFHYVLSQVFAWVDESQLPVGVPQAGDDADAVEWVSLADIQSLGQGKIVPQVAEIAMMAEELIRCGFIKQQ